jgi:hypothetical protein
MLLSHSVFVNLYYSTKNLAISHNVPAVCDVLPARIRALRSKDQGWQNVAEFWRGNGAFPGKAGARLTWSKEPEPPTGGEA